MSRGTKFDNVPKADIKHLRFARRFSFTGYIESLFTERIAKMILDNSANVPKVSIELIRARGRRR